MHGHSSKAGFLVRLAAACGDGLHGASSRLTAGRSGRRREQPRERTSGSSGARRAGAVASSPSPSTSATPASTAGVGRLHQYRVIRNGVDLARFDALPSPVAGRISCSVDSHRRSAPTWPCARSRSSGGASPRPTPPGRRRARRAAVERLAAELGLGDAARLLGTRADVPELLATAHCVLLASDYEGCPLSVLEAMAAGVPVVATAVGGIPELVADGETGLLTPRGDAQALARALETVLADRDLAGRLGAEGRLRARRELGRERMGAEVVALYDELLA